MVVRAAIAPVSVNLQEGVGFAFVPSRQSLVGRPRAIAPFSGPLKKSVCKIPAASVPQVSMMARSSFSLFYGLSEGDPMSRAMEEQTLLETLLRESAGSNAATRLLFPC